MRRKSTTFTGFFLIVLGAIGCIFTLLLGYNGNGHSDGGTIRLVESCVSLLTKSGMIVAGILLLKRSRFAWIGLVCILVFSAFDSLLIFNCLLLPLPNGLSQAGQEGRIFGRAVGLVLPPILYGLIIIYLMLPKTREEFSGGSSY